MQGEVFRKHALQHDVERYQQQAEYGQNGSAFFVYDPEHSCSCKNNTIQSR